MTNDQINKAVAEELGWKPFCCTDDYLWTMIDSAGCHAGRNYRGGLSEDHCWKVCNLDFTADHNAVAEMRKAVRPDEEEQFGSYLSDEVEEEETTFCRGVVLVINITPFKQCKSFLRLRGKWVES